MQYLAILHAFKETCKPELHRFWSLYGFVQCLTNIPQPREEHEVIFSAPCHITSILRAVMVILIVNRSVCSFIWNIMAELRKLDIKQPVFSVQK